MDVTAYTRTKSGNTTLTDWHGKTILDGRSELVREYRDGSESRIFTFGHGRYIVGYALGDNGMLFRGELLPAGTPYSEVSREAERVAEYWMERDAEADEEFQYRLAEEQAEAFDAIPCR